MAALADLITDGSPDLEAVLHADHAHVGRRVLFRAVALAAWYLGDQVAHAEKIAELAMAAAFAARARAARLEVENAELRRRLEGAA